MAIIKDWKIRSRGHRCFDTDRPFEDGERVCTGIFADPESDGYLRNDYCLEAWQRLSGDLQPYSFWQATYRVPEVEVAPESLGKESAEAMLRRMIDEDESGTENTRYILALMLERKKTLVPVDTQDLESRRMLFYEHKETGDVFIVADPQLHLAEIEAIQEEVLLLLQSKPKAVAAEESENDAPSEADDEALKVDQADQDEVEIKNDSTAEADADTESTAKAPGDEAEFPPAEDQAPPTDK